MTQKIEQLLMRKAEIERRISRAKFAVGATERSRRTRKNILAGACVLKLAERDEKFRAWLESNLSRYLVASHDRDLFSLPLSGDHGNE